MQHLIPHGEKKELSHASSTGELAGLHPAKSEALAGMSAVGTHVNGTAMARLLVDSLTEVDLFRDFDSGVLLSIAALCRLRRYANGQSVLAWKESSDDVFFVLEGRLRATLYSRQGREVAFDTLEPGDMFGELAAIDSGTRSTAVIAIGDCQVAVLSAQAFRIMLRAHPAVAMRVMQRLARLSRRLCDRIVDFSTLDVRQRVHGEVLRLAQRSGKSSVDCGGRVEIVDFPTHAELASRISTHREAVTRELNVLDRCGLIERESGQFAVCDVGAFARFVGRSRIG